MPPESYSQWRQRIARIDALNAEFWAIIDASYSIDELNELARLAKG
jgi:hypothetical protein